MNKFLTSVILMAGCSAAMSAQSFTLQKGEEGTVTYNNGDRITVPYTSQDWGGGFISYKWDSELFLHANSTCIAQLTVYSECNDVQVCGGGNCITTGSQPDNTVKKTISLEKGKDLNMQIEIISMTGTMPFDTPQEATVTCTADGQTVEVTLVFVPEENTALTDITGSAADFIAVSGRTLDYAFSSPVTLTVYTIAGRAALTHRLSGSGSLSLATLPAGVYIYRAGTRTGKFIVH